MAISRRFFLKSGSLTVLAAGVALSTNARVFGQSRSTNPGRQIPISAQQQPTFMFTRATFEPYVGSIFQAPNARGQMVSLTLLSATINKPASHTKLSTAPARDTDSFSLMFRAASPLPEFTSIHQISHPALGEFGLFLTPHPQAGGAMLYEAVFNHL
ncbi:MAG TPA: hypothetical protein VGN90_12690 [Pyrinomonadaceae bacterium]|jgi:hypothetical protein|nr:hypothetical protein [Pyrinomonadaceae bacterium]